MKKRTSTEYNNLSLWDNLTILLDNRGTRSEFISRIENIKRNSYNLEMPVRKSGKSNLQKGDIVEIRYNKHDAAYTFKASIKDLFVDSSGSIEISQESDTQRDQKRKYVRLDISEDINFRIIESSEENYAGMSPEFHGALLNVSAGGFLYETDKKIQTDSLLIINFDLKDHHKLENILAVVKRVEHVEQGKFLVGAEFITKENRSDYGLEKLNDYLPHDSGTFDEHLQRLIVQYIYQQQVKIRKEGRL